MPILQLLAGVSLSLFFMMPTDHIFAASVGIGGGNVVLVTNASPNPAAPGFFSGGTVFNPFPGAGAGAPLVLANTSTFTAFPFAGGAVPLTFAPGTIFNPFPFAGAGAPLVANNTSIFNPFPFAGAAVPLTFPGSGVVTGFQFAGSGSAPFRTNGTVASTPVAPTTVVVVTPATDGTTAVNALHLLPLTGATTPLGSSTTAALGPSSFVGTPASLSSNGLSALASAGAIQQPTAVLIQNPEPASWVLLGSGLAGLAWRARKRAKTPAL
jgi:hypothetical protein